MVRDVLGEVQFFSKVVAGLHEVGQALVGDVEEIDERLYVACF